MIIQWNTVATIAAPLITLFLGVWVNRWFESRPKLISYFGHVSSFPHPLNDSVLHIHTHSVILQNVGRRSATNVRLGHYVLPGFHISPPLAHHIEDLPGGSKEIVIPTIVPKQEVTISYLYFPPLIFDQIHAGIKSDQGFARSIRVILQRQFPRWFNVIATLLFFIGFVTILYLLVYAAKSLAR